MHHSGVMEGFMFGSVDTILLLASRTPLEKGAEM